MQSKAEPQWDQHLLVVFSVLAGLSLTEVFRVVSTSSFRLTELILSLAVFYIVLDNWYVLHRDLATIDIETSSEVVFYILALVTYVCLPYLYGVQTTSILDAPEWLLANLILIVLFDAIRKSATLFKVRRQRDKVSLDLATKKLIGAYVFYSLTGYMYTVLLSIVLLFSMSIDWPINLKAILAIAIWGIIRGIDTAVIPRIAGLTANIFLEGSS